MSIIEGKRESLQKEDHIVHIISQLEPVLSEEEISGLTPWFPEIEEKARELIQQLRPNETKALHPQVVASSALYDSFLHYESRTRVTIVFTGFKDATGLSVHRIQKVWKRFFDNRVHLDIRRLTPIEVSDNDTSSAIIPSVFIKIRESLDEVTDSTDEWLTNVEAKALDLTRDPTIVSDEAPELIAGAIVYESARRYHGKKLVHLPHRLLGRILGWGEAKVARVTKEMFGTS